MRKNAKVYGGGCECCVEDKAEIDRGRGRGRDSVLTVNP